jgi:hypothetical protein
VDNIDLDEDEAGATIDCELVLNLVIDVVP